MAPRTKPTLVPDLGTDVTEPIAPETAELPAAAPAKRTRTAKPKHVPAFVLAGLPAKTHEVGRLLGLTAVDDSTLTVERAGAEDVVNEAAAMLPQALTDGLHSATTALIRAICEAADLAVPEIASGEDSDDPEAPPAPAAPAVPVDRFTGEPEGVSTTSGGVQIALFRIEADSAAPAHRPFLLQADGGRKVRFGLLSEALDWAEELIETGKATKVDVVDPAGEGRRYSKAS